MGRLHDQSTQWPTSTRLISLGCGIPPARNSSSRKWAWGEILYRLYLCDGRFPPDGCELTEVLVEALLKYKPELRASDPGTDVSPAARARAIEGGLATLVDRDGEDARFLVHTPLIERCDISIVLPADSVHIEREEHSVIACSSWIRLSARATASS